MNFCYCAKESLYLFLPLPARRKAPMTLRETLTRIVLVALLFYSLASLLTVGRELKQAERLGQELRQQTESQQALKQELERRLAQEQSPEELQQMARERLGLVLPGEKLFYFF